jgi:hypothetical protein
MTRPNVADIADIDGVRLWIADHDARIDGFWENQHKFNDDVDEQFGEINQAFVKVYERITNMEKRLIWIVAGGAGFGGGVGAAIANFLNSGYFASLPT